MVVAQFANNLLNRIIKIAALSQARDHLNITNFHNDVVSSTFDRSEIERNRNIGNIHVGLYITSNIDYIFYFKCAIAVDRVYTQVILIQK